MVSAPRQQRSFGVHSPTAVAAAGENRGRGSIEALHAVKPQSVSGIIVSPSARPNHSLKLSANGVSRWPSSAGASPHFALAVQRATLSSPA